MSVGVRKRFHISLIVFLSVSAPRLTVPSLGDLEKGGRGCSPTSFSITGGTFLQELYNSSKALQHRLNTSVYRMSGVIQHKRRS